ncbi:MAG: response regulator with CheY-like receiver domain and winged-helix DNA-binding domain [Mycobacterium sp.]|jgi:two-component system response regulator PrrA|nr:response regulator with CheY-like receiver domain and winged-helix DNA-binding domain [Mycobacterium sp.]
MRSATVTRPYAIVVDVNMPVLEGVSVVTAPRAIEKDVPVRVRSAPSPVPGRQAGDDYLVKPFGSGEQVARVGALLRLREPAATFSSGKFTVSPLEVDIPVDAFTSHLRPKLRADRGSWLLAGVCGAEFALRAQ